MFQTYIQTINDRIRSQLAQFGKEKTSIRSPVEYALTSGGKRIRPLLVCLFANGLKQNRDVLDAAIAVEFIHTSTLIADDLPCMDNDDERRGRPSVHKAYNEASALLASYALISSAYGCIYANAKNLKKQGVPSGEVDAAYDDILTSTEKNFGCDGILGGQFDDMFGSCSTKTHMEAIIQKKTGALFEIAGIAGWLYGGGERAALPYIKEFSSNLGLLFQVQDDLFDLRKDSQNDGMNYALLVGEEHAKQVVTSTSARCKEILDYLYCSANLKDISELAALVDYIRFRSH